MKKILLILTTYKLICNLMQTLVCNFYCTVYYRQKLEQLYTITHSILQLSWTNLTNPNITHLFFFLICHGIFLLITIFTKKCIRQRNGILLPKLFWPTVRKKCSSVWEKLVKFEAEDREFAQFLRSLEQFIRTVKGQNNFW